MAPEVYRALGMHILKAKQSTYYGAALALFENAKRCYERSGLQHEWAALVADGRRAHHRKADFLGEFERLAAGHGPSDAPSFLNRARDRWSVQADHDDPGKGPTTRTVLIS